MIIAVSTGLYYTKNYIEILDIIANSGAKHIELFINQVFLDVPFQDIKTEIDTRDLKITSIHLPLTFLAYQRNEDECYWLSKGLEYMNYFDVKVLVSHFFYNNDEEKTVNHKHFKDIVNYNTQSEGFICTENLPNIPLNTLHQHPAKLKQFLLDNDAYLTYDTTHVATHGRDILHDFKLYQEHVKNIHLSDFKDGNEHKLLGSGDLPIKAFIRMLQTENYKGLVTLEYDFENTNRNPILTNEEASIAISDSLTYIHNIIHNEVL